MAAATKKKRKEEAYPWKAGSSSGHITNLKQSILETFDIYDTLTQPACPVLLMCPLPLLIAFTAAEVYCWLTNMP